MTTVGAKIDKLYQLRENKRALEEQVKLVGEQMEQVERELISECDTQGITKATGSKATVSVQDSTRFSADDWDMFYAFIHKNKMFHLLERRLSVTGCRELMEMKGRIPGVVPFTQRKINMRSIS